MSSSSHLNSRTLSLVTPNRLCLYYLWTDRYLDLSSFMVLKLSCPVNHLWICEFITLFFFLSSGSKVLTVKLIRLSLNSGLWAWCLLIGYVQTTFEPTGAQIQFTLAVPSRLAAKLIRLLLAADSEFSMSLSIMYNSSPLNRRVPKIEFTFSFTVMSSSSSLNSKHSEFDNF